MPCSINFFKRSKEYFNFFAGYIRKDASALFDDSRDLMLTFRGAGVPVPPVLRAVAGYVLGRRLEGLAERLEAGFLRSLQLSLSETESDTDDTLGAIAELLAFGRSSEIAIGLEPLEQAFGTVLGRLLEDLLRAPDPAVAVRFLEVIGKSYDLHFPLDRRPLEDVAFLILRKHRGFLLQQKHIHQSTEGGNRDWKPFEDLAEALHLNIHWILDMGEGEDAATGKGA